jgi:hypothetical protein
MQDMPLMASAGARAWAHVWSRKHDSVSLFRAISASLLLQLQEKALTCWTLLVSLKFVL